LSPALRRDALLGACAGLLGGLVVGLAVLAQGSMATMVGPVALSSSGLALAAHLIISATVGAGYGVIFRYEPQSYATGLSSGLLYGLLWWIVWPLTLLPLLMGRGPTWSLVEASADFPSLIGYLFYGGISGLGFHVLVALYLRYAPPARTGPAAGPPSPAIPIRRVLILGGGFAGVGAAQRLEQLLPGDRTLECTLVSQSNYLLFTPMLSEVASSALEAQHISTPVRAVVPRTRFRRAEVEAIDLSGRAVRVRSGPTAPPETLGYDHLVLALGAIPHFHDLSGVEAHSFTLKSLEDAMRLRNHVIAMLEQADVETDPEQRLGQLTFVVAGGGFAGTETIAELFDLVHNVRRYYPNVRRDDLRFVLIHSRDRILPELSAGLAAYALRNLQLRGIEFVLGARVSGATPQAVLLGPDREIATRTFVWTAGNQPNPSLRTLPCERNRAGAVIAETTLRLKGFENVWAIGDCAEIPDPYNEGRPYPPTAQHALREGKVAAENIAAVLAGKPPQPLRFRTIGLLAVLGQRTAVAEIWGHQFSGLLAWLMWRTIYLSKLPGLEKKVRVWLDWTIDLVFPRDIVLTANPAPPSPPPAAAGPVVEEARPRATLAPEAERAS
jgi:NADH dehydrogenase